MSPSERTTKIGLQGFTPPSVEIIAAEFPALEIVELIGAGGMGAVYKARQPELDRMVALKILPEGIGEGFNAEERFDREAKAMAALSHPNLVPIFEYGRSKDASFAYFLMEFIDGKSLHEEIAENGAMEPTRAANLIGQICAGLEYAHSRGIIHRDIKAANILVGPDDRVRIVDFGLVKMQENAAALTLRSTAMGTPLYMSPEQLRDSGSVDHRADIYAIGILFHQMLTGSPPQGAWIPASEKNPAVDKRYDAVVGLAMREDPDQRFQSTAELRDAVAAVLEPKSSKGKAILLGLVGIAALLIAAFFVTNLQDNSSPTQPSLANENPPEQSSTSPFTSEDDPVIPTLPEPELTLEPHDHTPGKPFFVRYDSIDPAWFPDLEGAVPDDIIQFTIPPNAPLRAVALLHSDGQISEIDFERPDTIAPVQGIDGPVHQIFENYGHFYWMHDDRVTSTAPGWEALADNDESFTNFAVGSVYCVGRTQSGTPRIFIRDLPSFDRTLREGVEDLLPNPMPELAKLDAGARKILALRPDGSLLFSATPGHAHVTPPTDLGEVIDIAVASNLCVAITKNGRARIWGTHRVSEEFKAEIAALRDVDKVVSASAGLGRVAIRYGPDKQWLVISQTGESNWRIERETGKALRGFDFVALGDEFAGGIQVRGVETEAPVEMAKLLPPHEHAPGEPFFVPYDSAEPEWFPDLSGTMPDDVIQFTIPPNFSLSSVALVHVDGRVSEINSEKPGIIAPVQGIDGPVHEVIENYGRLIWMRDGRVTSTSSGWEELAENDESFTNFAAGTTFSVGRTQEGTKRTFLNSSPTADQSDRKGIDDLLPTRLPELIKLDAGSQMILGLRPDGDLLFSAPPQLASRVPPADLGKVKDIGVAGNVCVAVTEDGRARAWGSADGGVKTEVAALRGADKIVSASAGLTRIGIRHGPDKQWLILGRGKDGVWRVEHETGRALRGCEFVALGAEFAGGLRLPSKKTNHGNAAQLLTPQDHAPGTPFFVRYDSASPLWFPELDGEAPADIAHITIPTYEKHFAVSLIHSDGRASEIRPDSPDRIAAINGINEPIHQSLDAYGTIYWLRNGRVTSQGIGWTSLAKNDERFTHFAAGNGYCIGRRTDGATRFFPQDGSFVEPERRAAADSLLPAVLPEITKLDAGYYPILALRPNGTLLFSASPGEEWRAPPKDVGKVIDIAVTANLSVVVLEQGRARVWGATIDPEIVSEIESLPNVHKVVSASGGAARFAIQHGEDKQWLVVFKTSAAKWVIQRKTGKALRGVDFVALGTGFAGGIRAGKEQ